MDGIVLIDKPPGPTSFDVVRLVRRTAGQRKVGHAGTLDPMASGLLVVCLGQGTKLVPFLMDTDKRYRAGIALGKSTDTDDAQGQIIDQARVPELTRDEIEQALSGFKGHISQTPPAYAALKSDGEPLYRKARRGETVEPEPRQVSIQEIALLNAEGPKIEIEVTCGKGTYIRSLARDLGKELKIPAHLAALRRLETAGFSVEEAIRLDRIEGRPGHALLTERLIAPKDALLTMPKVKLSLEQENQIKNGRPIPVEQLAAPAGVGQGSRVALISSDEKLRAVAQIAEQHARPVRVFH